MTVASSTSKVSYSGNSSTVVFSVPFYFLENDHLIVIIRDANEDETEQTLNTDYTVSGAGNVAGGSITMTSAPATGETLVISRDVPATQETDYTENDPFPAQSHEQALDKLTMLVQQNAEAIQRALTAPLTDPDTINMIFPPLEERKGKALVFDETTGDPKAGIVPDAYQGADSSDPTERLNGDSLQADDFYFNDSTNKIRIYNGSSWADFDPDLTIEAGDISSGAATDGYVLTADGSGGAAWETPFVEIVQDTTPQLGGDLDTNGNDIEFATNDKARFLGAGSNALEIYYDSSEGPKISSTEQIKIDSIINPEAIQIQNLGFLRFQDSLGTAFELKHNVNASITNSKGDLYISTSESGSTSDLILQGSNVSIQVNANESAIEATANAEVSLYYDNNKKFETTNSGVTVTGSSQTNGNARITQSLYLDGASSSLHWSPSGGTRAQAYYTSSPDPQPGLKFDIDIGGVDGGNFAIFTQGNEQFRIDPYDSYLMTVFGGAVFNESGSDVDFRIESDTDANAFFLQGSNGSLGLGTATPNASAKVDITSTTQGFLPPRMTDAQRDAISTPAAGLMIYNTTTNKLNFYNGSAWRAVDDSAV